MNPKIINVKLGIFITIILFIVSFFLIPGLAKAETTTELNAQIKAKQLRAAELKKQIDAYQSALAEKQAQSLSLKRQLNVLDTTISRTQLNLKTKELELSTVTLQLRATALEIAGQERTISDQKTKIAETLRQLNQRDQQGLLAMFTINNSLNEFFEQANYLETLQSTLQQNINQLQTLKTELENKEQTLANFRIQLTKAKENLQQAKSNLEIDQQAKQSLLSQTKLSENRFQNLLTQVRQEQTAANRDIQSLEAKLRAQLKTPGHKNFQNLGDAVFLWPVNPYRGISTYFYDPAYIFRKYFEHPGIDIPSPQNNSIKAPADGYVARAKNAGLGYSYIMLIHKDGFSTVYGHVSRIDVVEDSYVNKGQIIGAVGGLPGTRGAGPLTTGPHLHFEIRSNGIPVNPLDYLPNY